MSHHHSAGYKQSHLTDLDSKLQRGTSAQPPTASEPGPRGHTRYHPPYCAGATGKEGPSATQRLSRGIGASLTGVSLESKKAIWP